MAITRSNQFFSKQYSWRYELLFFVLGCLITFGFVTWFKYGMIKNSLVSLSIRDRIKQLLTWQQSS